MSKTCILCHIVFGTKRREGTIELEKRRELYAYLHGIIQNRKCITLRIGGIEDHIHLLVDLHPSVALADLVKALKQGSSKWLKDNWLLPNFGGWGSGYFAASVGIEGKEACVNYIKNQEEHHKRRSYVEELQDSVRHHGLEWFDTEW